jgi:DNA-binding NarL/FixJ family response regulator
VITVLLADDQALVRAGLRALLDSQPDIEVVGEADDGEAALRMAADLVPDVVLMDIRMPGMDGLEATRRIVQDEHLDRTRVVILTTFDVDDYVFEALRVGASGFLVKDTEPQVLLQGAPWRAATPSCRPGSPVASSAPSPVRTTWGSRAKATTGCSRP